MVSLSGLGTQGYEVPFQRERIVLLVVETTTDGGILSHDSAVGRTPVPKIRLDAWTPGVGSSSLV